MDAFKICVCVCVLVAQSCLTLCDPMNCNPTGFSIHRILQAKHWSGKSSSVPGDLPNSGTESRSLAMRVDSNHLSHQGSPIQNQQRIANQSLQILSSQRKKTSLKGKGKLGGL